MTLANILILINMAVMNMCIPHTRKKYIEASNLTTTQTKHDSEYLGFLTKLSMQQNKIQR